jgi:hypothetical protein
MTADREIRYGGVSWAPAFRPLQLPPFAAPTAVPGSQSRATIVPRVRPNLTPTASQAIHRDRAVPEIFPPAFFGKPGAARFRTGGQVW